MKQFLVLGILLSILLPSRITGLKFLPIYKTLVIKVERNTPARYAINSLNTFLSYKNNFEYSEPNSNGQTNGYALHTKNVEPGLPTMFRSVEIQLPTVRMIASEEVRDQNWLQGMSLSQRQRIRLAEDSSQAISESIGGISVGEANELAEASRPAESNLSDKKLSDKAGRRIKGPIEIRGGLAVTDKHFLEVRRKQAGIVKESGRIHLKSATYELNVEEFVGIIEARLVTDSGQILGQGKVAINQFKNIDGILQGPKIEVNPVSGFSILGRNMYGNEKAIAGADLTALKGQVEQKLESDNKVNLSNISATSNTIVRIAKKDFMQTSIFSGAIEDLEAPLFPSAMIKALTSIVSGRNISDQDVLNQSVIWGEAKMDGKAISGITVEIENLPDLQPIYFNALMLPDPSLTATSENGLYAFIDVQEGFSSVRANRGNNFFGYTNVMIESGSVAVGDIVYSTKKHAVPLRVYDAFSGTGVDGTLEIQGLASEVVATEESVISLPEVDRFGFIHFNSSSNDYLSAQYLYNDLDESVNIPAISWQWILQLKSQGKIVDQVGRGAVVGFVNNFNFDAFVAGPENDADVRIIYFDMTGRIVKENTGKAGGGFIIFNLSADTHEIIVLPKGIERVHSKVIPVNANSLSVVSFIDESIL